MGPGCASAYSSALTKSPALLVSAPRARPCPCEWVKFSTGACRSSWRLGLGPDSSAPTRSSSTLSTEHEALLKMMAHVQPRAPWSTAPGWCTSPCRRPPAPAPAGSAAMAAPTALGRLPADGAAGERDEVVARRASGHHREHQARGDGLVDEDGVRAAGGPRPCNTLGAVSRLPRGGPGAARPAAPAAPAWRRARQPASPGSPRHPAWARRACARRSPRAPDRSSCPGRRRTDTGALASTRMDARYPRAARRAISAR